MKRNLSDIPYYSSSGHIEIPELFYSRIMSKYENYKSLMDHLNGFAYNALAVPGSAPLFTLVSHTFEKLTGISSDEIMQQSTLYPDLIHPEDRDYYLYTIEQAVSSQTDFELHYRLIRPDGEILYLNDKGGIRTDEKDNPLLIQGLITDATRAWKAETALRKKEQNLDIVLSNIREYIYSIIYKNGVPVSEYHSPRSLDVTGYSQEEYINDHDLWFRMIHPEDRTLVTQNLNTLRRNGGSASFEHRIIHKDGSIRWVQNTVSMQTDAAGNILRTDGFIFDITERIESEQMRSRLFSAMSHDIRTPMHGMLGLTELLLQDPSLTEHHRKFIEMIHTSGEHLMSILNDILDFSKAESRRLRVKIEKFSLRSVIEQFLPSFRIQMAQKKLDFIYEIESSVPDNLSGDPLCLSRILMNLLSNAVKFTDHGKILFWITKETQEENTVTLTFQICDTGCGIPSEKLQYVFEPYVQFSKKKGGTGLGTAIAKQFTELLGGSISVTSPSEVFRDFRAGSAAQSVWGPGTDFTVKIPFHISH